ncbi:DUF805 domain-containing protein [Sphingomonas sp.]|uniref:DUF805 domain-containing protein n=1 Tax=Sphingomonas sp. TaxID=28214 RepID=UPI00286CE6A4|nr:DUF805 domain-containing protein [Sphingomonas sp.]
MPYNPKGEIRDHWRRIAANLVNFRGRSRRSELVAYWLAILLIGAAFVLTIWAFPAFIDLDLAWLQLLLALPFIPLFARRLHDQNRSGWFAMIVPVLIGLRAYELWLYRVGQLPAPKLGFPANLLIGALGIVGWAIILWPGTDGPNRFGDDPRLEP